MDPPKTFTGPSPPTTSPPILNPSPPTPPPNSNNPLLLPDPPLIDPPNLIPSIPCKVTTGTTNNGMELDNSTEIANPREAATLLPYQPPSPSKKKARLGKRKLLAEKKPLFNLEEDNWARFFVIKKKDGSFSKDCPFELESLIRKEIGISKNIRKQGDGTLCIEADSPAQAQTILGLLSVKDAEVEVGPHRRLNTSQGVVTCPDLLNSTLEAIKEGLIDEGVVDVRRIKRRQGDSLVDTASLVLTFNRPRPPASIKAAFYRLLVRPYIPSPMRCFKCQKYGHTAQRCREEKTVCVCGKLSHEGECTPPYTCVNCGGDHNARAPSCPVLQEEKEVQRIKTLQNLTYKEAREIVKGKSYVKSTITYSEKVKEIQATPVGVDKAPSPVLREFMEKFNINPKLRNGARRVENPQVPPLAASRGQSQVGLIPPPTDDASLGPWQEVTPKRSPKKASQSKKSAPSRVADVNKNLTASDFLKVTTEASPKPSDDGDASDSDGAGPSSRTPRRRRRGWPKGKPRKTYHV